MGICVCCGKPLSGYQTKYCSRRCHDLKTIKPKTGVCINCGKTVFRDEKTNRLSKYCSEACKHQHLNGKFEPHPELIKICPVCGKEFSTYRSRKITCSNECSKRLRAVKHDHRYDNITDDSNINLFRLSIRDNQKCALCGELVNWEDRHGNLCGNSYPSIDHIVPISKGGRHSWNNVQLAHKICNTRKSNKTIIL